MNAEIKEQWATALESGDFEQGKWRLKTPGNGNPNDSQCNDTYCCLGVLTELAVEAGIVRWSDKPLFDCNPDDGEQSESGAVLNKRVVEWAGLDAPVPTIGDTDAWHLNDSCKFSADGKGTHVNDFSDIAALIREHL